VYHSAAVQDRRYDQVSARYFEPLHQIFGKKERARYGKVEESLGYFLKRYPKASALCMEKPKPLKQLASPMSEIVRRKLPKGLDLDQAALLSFFLSLREGVRRQRSHCSVSFRDPELPCNVDIGMLTSWDATPPSERRLIYSRPRRSEMLQRRQSYLPQRRQPNPQRNGTSCLKTSVTPSSN
jgi:hypothetical protein